MVSIYELKLGAEKLEILKALSAEIEKAINSVGKIDSSRLNTIYNDILEKANQVLQDKNLVQELKDKVDVAHKDISEKAATINQKFAQQQALLQSLQELKAEIEALLKSGLIDDSTERTTTTYSSKKIRELLKSKTDKADFDDLKSTVGNKLNKTETAADSAKLGGSPASDYASKTEINTLGTNLANKLGKNEQAADSLKLGGLAADKYAKKDDIPAAPQAATETKAGIVKIKKQIGNTPTDDVVPTEKAVADALAKGFSNSKLQSGYTKFPNGLIIQWGLVETITADKRKGVVFPIAFPNACLNAGATYISPDPYKDAGGTVYVAKITAAGLEVEYQAYAQGWQNHPTINAYWFAIGY